MNTTTSQAEADRYLQAVRAHFGDTPPAEIAELLDDLQQHLAEVASEDDGPLAERLGPPERYAEELRASAGLPAGGQSQSGLRKLWSVGMAHVGGRVEQWLANPWLGNLRESGMVWFIARGYALALAWGVITTWHGGLSAFPLPSIGGNGTFTLFATASLIAASVAAGNRGRRGRRRLDVLINVALVVVGIWALVDLRTMSEQVVRYDHAEAIDVAVPDVGGGLVGPDGAMVTNLYPYDAQGRPLDNVLLYDQDGRPVELVVTHTPHGVPVVTAYPVDRDGQPVTNAYPQHQAPRRDADHSGYDEDTWGARPTPDVPVLEQPSPAPSPSAQESPAGADTMASEPAAAADRP